MIKCSQCQNRMFGFGGSSMHPSFASQQTIADRGNTESPSIAQPPRDTQTRESISIGTLMTPGLENAPASLPRPRGSPEPSSTSDPLASDQPLSAGRTEARPQPSRRGLMPSIKSRVRRIVQTLLLGRGYEVRRTSIVNREHSRETQPRPFRERFDRAATEATPEILSHSDDGHGPSDVTDFGASLRPYQAQTLANDQQSTTRTGLQTSDAGSVKDESNEQASEAETLRMTEERRRLRSQELRAEKEAKACPCGEDCDCASNSSPRGPRSSISLSQVHGDVPGASSRFGIDGSENNENTANTSRPRRPNMAAALAHIGSNFGPSGMSRQQSAPGRLSMDLSTYEQDGDRDEVDRL